MKRCPCEYPQTRKSLIYEYYRPRLDQGSLDHEKLGWESREAQFRRFDVLLDTLVSPGISILDVGCGLGNLLDACHMKNMEVDYTGVDIIPDMILKARQRHPDAQWYCCDIFSENPLCPRTYDIVYSSGIFNIDLGNNPEFLLDAIDLFLTLSNQYVCFNLLSDRSKDQEEGYFYYNEDMVVRRILNKFPLKKHNITIESDYLENDFSVIMRK